jgi:UPF0716 protein FxsA
MFRLLFLLFFVISIVEIYFLIKVGSVIGALWTVFLVVGTAVLGAALLRQQGFSTFQRAQQSLAQGQLPATAMLEGVALVISGALLLTPGFVTDTIGFLLLTPLVRQKLIEKLFASDSFTYHQQTMYRHRSGDDGVIIDGEVIEEHDKHLK